MLFEVLKREGEGEEVGWRERGEGRGKDTKLFDVDDEWFPSRAEGLGDDLSAMEHNSKRRFEYQERI